MTAINTARYDEAILSVTTKFQQGREQEVLKNAQDARVAVVALGAIYAVGAILLTVISLATLVATTGLSALLLFPAYQLGQGANSANKMTRILDLVIEEAQNRTRSSGFGNILIDGAQAFTGVKPTWQRRVELELDGTYDIYPVFVKL